MREIVTREAVKKESVEDESVKDGRLNKWLSQMGVCSRWEVDRLIQEGRVLVDGCPTVIGQKVPPGQTAVCNGIPVSWGTSGGPEPVLLTVNKPRGIVCTTSSKDGAENIMEHLEYPRQTYPVGRLDKESEGLFLVTSRRDLTNKIMRSGSVHEKEYTIAMSHAVTTEFMDQMTKDVYPEELDVGTWPCRPHKVEEKTFSIILIQGLNRQTRRTCEAHGYHVRQLVRVWIMNLCLGNLKTGESRRVTPEEYRELTRLLKDLTSLPAKYDGW